jgi:hypothetical protein
MVRESPRSASSYPYRLHCRVGPYERAGAAMLAAEDGVTVSELVRNLITSECARRKALLFREHAKSA